MILETQVLRSGPDWVAMALLPLRTRLYTFEHRSAKVRLPLPGDLDASLVQTDGQSIDARVKKSRAAGAEKVWRETASGAKRATLAREASKQDAVKRSAGLDKNKAGPRVVIRSRLVFVGNQVTHSRTAVLGPPQIAPKI